MTMIPTSFPTEHQVYNLILVEILLLSGWVPHHFFDTAGWIAHMVLWAESYPFFLTDVVFSGGLNGFYG